MAIDDPISAVEKQLELETLSSDPILAKIAELAATLPLPPPIGQAARKILGRLAADRIEKIELTLAVIKDELRRHQRELLNLAADTDRTAEWFALVQDGLKKAEETRAKSRVTRIGRILAKSLTATPRPSADDVEEMMRCATQLSDREVELLGELVSFEGEVVKQMGRIARYDAWQRWPQGKWGERPDSEIDSAFAKLESFGLVSSVVPPNTLNVHADLQNRYALLKKGLDFVEYCKAQNLSSTD